MTALPHDELKNGRPVSLPALTFAGGTRNLRRPLLRWIVLVTLLVLQASTSMAGEIGHYAAGVMNIRDLAMPEPGFYAVLYNYAYRTDQLNDRHGDEVGAVTVQGPFGRRKVTVRLDVNVDAYALSPALVWVSNWSLLGAKVGALVAPSFGNTSVGAALSSSTGRGGQAEASQFGVGDLFVQPVWLGWTGDHYDVAFGMGFYAPIGKYDVESVTLPHLGTIKAEAADNIGLGFWTQQTQLAGYWYPFNNKGTAIGLGLTHEINTKKADFDLTPGQNLSLNWGVSQFLPITSDHTLLLEVGPTGYDTWQVTNDSGRLSTGVRDEVHAAGLQLGLTHVPWNLAVNFHWFHEYAARDRFQGDVLGLSIAKKFL